MPVVVLALIHCVSCVKPFPQINEGDVFCSDDCRAVQTFLTTQAKTIDHPISPSAPAAGRSASAPRTRPAPRPAGGPPTRSKDEFHRDPFHGE